MQPTHRSNRLLLPVRSWFVFLSLFLALVVSYIPTGRLPGVPDWVAVVLVFWCIREPSKVGMGTAFVLGLLADVGHGAAMGQHALAYVVLAYVAAAFSRRILWFSTLQQALHVLPMLLLAQLVMLVVRLAGGDEFPGWWWLLSSLTGTLAWVPIGFMLLLPQYQPVERDANRPI